MNSFSETQRFTQWWLWAVLLVSLIIVVSAHFVMEHTVDGNKIAFHSAISFAPLVLILMIIILFAAIRLNTTIDANGISYQFSPIHIKPRTLSWDEIDRAYIRQYSPLGEYGGWGIRYTFGNGKAYNIAGNMGLQLELKNGKKILLGTQKHDEIRELLESLKR